MDEDSLYVFPLLPYSHPRIALWSSRFERYSPSGEFSVARWKPPEDIHLKEGDQAELSFVAKYSKTSERILEYQGILQQTI